MQHSDVILTGVPRSGTTLTCQLLSKVPNTVALHEPMQGMDSEGRDDPKVETQLVQEFFQQQRRSILDSGRAMSRNIDGKLPDNPFGSALSNKGARRHVDAQGEITIDKELSADFLLVIKHTNRFAAILGSLVEVFPAYALVRNPLSTLSSWQTVSAGIRTGRSGAATKSAPELAAKMSGASNRLERQMALLDWFFEQFLRYLPQSAIIRYEDIVESGGRALQVISPGADQLDEPLTSLNANRLYDQDAMRRIGQRLLRSDGAYWQVYSKDNVTSLLDDLETAPQTRTATD